MNEDKLRQEHNLKRNMHFECRDIAVKKQLFIRRDQIKLAIQLNFIRKKLFPSTFRFIRFYKALWSVPENNINYTLSLI